MKSIYKYYKERLIEISGKIGAFIQGISTKNIRLISVPS